MTDSKTGLGAGEQAVLRRLRTSIPCENLQHNKCYYDECECDCHDAKDETMMDQTATATTRTIQRWNCPDCMECIFWQRPMTKAERIYYHYRVGHNEGGSLIAPQLMPDTGTDADTSHCAYHDKANCYECGRCPERVTPDAGEWRIFEHCCTRILDQSGCLVAEAQTGEQALQIVRDHAAARQVQRLVEALELTHRLLVNQQACEQTLCSSCEEARQTVLETVFTVLDTAVKGERG